MWMFFMNWTVVLKFLLGWALKLNYLSIYLSSLGIATQQDMTTFYRSLGVLASINK